MEPDLSMMQEQILNCLRSADDTFKVTFLKSDGGERVMRCTLNQSMIPAEKLPKTESTPNLNVQRVFDLDKQEWRSFRWDSVISTEQSLMENPSHD